ncbi:hypothetical protein Tco_0450610 [Tanacetum coccineum]
MKDKMVYKGDNIVGALMNVPIFVGTFSIMTDFAVLEDMDAYRDEGMGDIIVGDPFLRKVGIKTKCLEGIITLYNGDDEVAYQILRSHPRNPNDRVVVQLFMDSAGSVMMKADIMFSVWPINDNSSSRSLHSTLSQTPAVPSTEDSPAVPEQTTVETVTNMTPENRAHYESEKEAIHLILTGIGDEIYSTVDACQTAQEMWEAIERLQQGESLNYSKMLSTNLFWEFGQFTSHDGETIESYYTRFYKMMNEMIRNNLTVATMQVNVQFLQQLQPEWSRFVTIVKQQHKLDEVSYHNLL